MGSKRRSCRPKKTKLPTASEQYLRNREKKHSEELTQDLINAPGASVSKAKQLSKIYF